MVQPIPTRATLAEWVAREAVSFALDSPDSLNAAVDRLIAALGDGVEILGFGEAIHGSEETLILRNRLFRRLVEAHGYSAIAVESSFPRSRIVNEYVAGRGPSAYDTIAESGFSHNFGRLAANGELVEWMRGHNADPAHRVKLQFYGCDSPTEMMSTDSPRQLLSFALDYLAAIDGDGGGERRARIEALLGADADWENPAALMDPALSVGLSSAATALRIATEDLLTELATRRPELIASSDRDRFLEALQHAAMARQMLNYHAGLAEQSDDRISKLLGIRDVMIADTLAYVGVRERGRGKVLAFAHNRHLQRSKLEWQLGPHLNLWWPAGAHLTATFGPRYAVVGTGLGVSAYNGIGQPEPDTLEASLLGSPGQALLIPTHGGQGLPAPAIAALPTRSGSARNSTYMPLGPESFTDFDWLAVLHSTTYNRGGPPLP
jgi:erythromycin esterase-like protein